MADGATPQPQVGAAESLAVAVQSAAEAVGAAVAAKIAAKDLDAMASPVASRGIAEEAEGSIAGTEFDWRKGQEVDDGGGPLDDRVEGAIER